MSILDRNKVSIFIEGLDHAEGIAWGKDGFIYAGGEVGQVYQIDPSKHEIRILGSTGGLLLGITIDGANNIYVCDVRHRVVQKVTLDGRVRTFSSGSPDEPFIFPNFPVFDSNGNMYVSDSGVWNKDNGKIYRISPNGDGEVWCRELTEFPNGLCLNKNETHLYVAMSLNPPRISRIEIRPDGSAGQIETVVYMPRTVPDGLAFDKEGNLYIGCYRPDVIYRYTLKNELEVLAEDYQGELIAAPTNIAFCGKNHDILLSTNLAVYHLTQYHLNVIGMPLNYPDLFK